MEKEKQGTLYIVGTPIGNLGDITIRALETLKKVDVILAEDTRHTLKLLNHFAIQKHLISYHRHNEDEKIKNVVELLDAGKDLALVSDAGMPIISDPGQNLIHYLVENHYAIETIPGVTAVITAIVKSGLDSTRFTFEGFLSVNKKQRRDRLLSLKEEVRTMVFYEAPHKILATLKDMKEAFGNRNICIAKELTKLHEEYRYTTFEQAITTIEEFGIKGELVLMIEGANINALKEEEQEKASKINAVALVEEYIEKGMAKKEAIKQVAKEKGVPKNEVYQEYLNS
ncbi:MAG: 16S rRNA (cytidine(1402)-2'-O)-methyltransferase [Clostridia bacterium]|nr:16S rRNA (cytidine(1402)-2'-O)-methyltransferase [Clostridia bacterium]